MKGARVRIYKVEKVSAEEKAQERKERAKKRELECALRAWRKMSRKDRAEWRKKFVAEDKAKRLEERKALEEQRAVERLKDEAAKPLHAKGRSDYSLDLSVKCPNTDPRFIREVQGAVVPQVSVGGTKSLDQMSAEFSREQQAAKIRFDKIYRPFVYKVLLAGTDKNGLGFSNKNLNVIGGASYRVPCRGKINGEEVYSEVWKKLFGDGGGSSPALLGFDVTRDRVGRGAFRDYLRMVVKSVYFSMTHRDTVVLKDLNGNTIYKQNRKTGLYLLDKKGKRIPERVPRMAQMEDDALSITVSAYQAQQKRPEFERNIYKRRININYLAYLTVHARSPKDGWFYVAAEEIFEKGVPADRVLADCLKKGVIAKRGAFDKALSIFRKAIAEKSHDLECAISGRDDDHVLSEGERLDREWAKLADKIGRHRVEDVRMRVMKAMMDAFEEGTR